MASATWGAVFNRAKARGCDPSDAAYQADQWEKRQQPKRWAHCPSTHCERSEECRSPHECCASLRALQVLENSKASLADATNNPVPLTLSDAGSEKEGRDDG